ncbi:hypothetical protein [Parvularcula oceani]|uniref:hypothetical protein n=1 Tax=Parvularcula oceani TaxID=1247963 RepID=UPI0004E1941C|nr:hypothetical protein [Parvularcula oceani]
MEQWIVLLGIVVGLFILAAVLKTVLGLVFRYLLFVAITLLIYQQRRGGEVLDWLTTELAVEIGLVALLSFAFTSLVAATALRGTRLRILIVPVLGFASALLLSQWVTQWTML